VEALAARLSQLDAEAEGALRVVMFYDTLMRRRVDLTALARASAGLAECVAGIRLSGSGRLIRMAPDGMVASAPPLPASTTASVMLDEEEIGAVWLERRGQSFSLDQLLLDRLAIAVTAVVEKYGPAQTTMADPALVELVVSAEGDDASRERALRLLGFARGMPVHALAVRSQLPLDHVAGLVCPGRPVKAASVADVGVILASSVDSGRLPAGVRAGIGAAERPDLSWTQACTALRFTTERQPVVHYKHLGGLALLAQLSRDALQENADVTAIARAAVNPEDLDVLEVYSATGSVRRAAEILHLHHSSVARRLEQVGKTLEMKLTEPTGLMRAKLALTAWRLLNDAGISSG
jgi:PucR C-terminal helix-turn-helix domain